MTASTSYPTDLTGFHKANARNAWLRDGFGDDDAADERAYHVAAFYHDQMLFGPEPSQSATDKADEQPRHNHRADLHALASRHSARAYASWRVAWKQQGKTSEAADWRAVQVATYYEGLYL